MTTSWFAGSKVYAHGDHTDHWGLMNYRGGEGLTAVVRSQHHIDSLIMNEEWDDLTEQGLQWLRELARIRQCPSPFRA